MAGHGPRSSLRRSISTRPPNSLNSRNIARERARIRVLQHRRHRARRAWSADRREVEPSCVLRRGALRQPPPRALRPRMRPARAAAASGISFASSASFQALVHDSFVCGVHVDYDEPALVLREDVHPCQLRKRRAERHRARRVGGRRHRFHRGPRAEQRLVEAGVLRDSERHGVLPRIRRIAWRERRETLAQGELRRGGSARGF